MSKVDEKLQGIFIYQDGNMTIHYNPINKKAHVLSSSDVEGYNKYQISLAIPILAIYVLISFLKIKSYIAVFCGLLLLASIYIYYQIKFFNKLPVKLKFKPRKRSFLDHLANNYSRIRLNIIMILFVVMAVLTFMFIKLDNVKGIDLIVNYVLIIIYASIGIVFYVAQVKKNFKRK